jgi:hypothetical protein
MRCGLIILGLACAGCIVEKDVSSEQKMNMATSSLDGGRVVAVGKPPLAFQYPGNGRLAIRNVTEQSLIYSLDLPGNQTIGLTLVQIDPEKKQIVTITSGRETVVVSRIDTSDIYQITYVASELPAKR